MNNKTNQPFKHDRHLIVHSFNQKTKLYHFITAMGNANYPNFHWNKDRQMPNELVPLLGDYNPSLMIKLKRTEINKLYGKGCLKLSDDEIFKWIQNQYNLCYKYSDKQINPYLFNKLTSMIKYYIYQFIKDTIDWSSIEPVEHEEFEWFRRVESKGFMSYVSGEYTKLYNYDIKSSYPYILSLATFFVPIKKGIETYLTKETFEKYLLNGLSYGLYRCKILGSSPFVQNNDKFRIYTHFDINVAHKEGLTIEIKIDDHPNCLLYPTKTHCIPGNKLYGDYIEWIFQLKNKYKDCKIFKHMITAMWGVMSEKLIYKFLETDDALIIPENYAVVEENIHKKFEVRCVDINNVYKTEFGRLKPFILAKQKTEMYKFMKPHQDKIKRVMVDSIMTTERITQYDKAKQTIGHMVFDKEYNNVKLKGLNRWNFDCPKCHNRVLNQDVHLC
jgi:hypothetical protein